MQLIAGVDPGLSGAVALLCSDTGALEIFDMPLNDFRGKKHLDIYDLGRRIDATSNMIKKVIIEEPNAMPKQGVVSSFRFGYACGVAQMVFAANLIPMTLVRPATWKKAMGVPADKDASRHMASRLMPQHSHLWARKKDDGRAEAALLAWYGLHHVV